MEQRAEQTCLKKLVTVSVAGRKVAKLHMSSAMLIRSKPFFFLSFHVPWPFFSARKKREEIAVLATHTPARWSPVTQDEM